MNKTIAAAASFLREPGDGRMLNVLGVTHIYKATGAETGGSFSLWEAIVPPGACAPPHRHSHKDESFYVLSGEIMVELEDQAEPLRVCPGGFFFGARGRRHAFRNAGNQPARVLVLSSPSRGLDRMFAEIAAATAAGSLEIGRLACIAAEYGVAVEPAAA